MNPGSDATASPDSALPLSGIRVIEVSMLLNGATTTMHLADMGADVIKIESPFLGDYIRLEHTMHLHTQVNKGKRSIALDLRNERGRQVLDALLKTADVFVTNLLTPATKRLGISYDQLAVDHPGLVYCQITGFGASGPYATLPAHGQMMDAIAGTLPAETGPDGLARAKQPPRVRSGSLSVAGESTAMGGIFGAFHIAAALTRKAATRMGCYIDVSAANCALASAWTSAVGQLNLPPERQWWNREDAGRDGARYQFYRTSDDLYVMFCPEERKFWAAFCDLVQRPDLMDREAGYELRCEIQTIIGARPRDEWMKLALAHHLPLAPANEGMAEVRDDPQMRAREMLHDAPDPAGNPFTYLGQPSFIDGTPCGTFAPAPSLGQHTDDLLREIGYSQDDIEELARDSITSAPVVGDYIITSAQDTTDNRAN